MYTIKIREVLTYEREATIALPPGAKDIMGFLNEAEKKAETAEDVVYRLEKMGCTIIEHVDDDLSSPDDMEVEITDYWESVNE